MISEIVARLEALCPSLASVGSAEDIDALTKGTAPKSGATFVVPFTEQAEDNALGMGGFRQLVEVRTLIAFVVRRHDDARGGKRAAAYDQLKGEIEAALAGWEVTPDSGPFELVSSRGQPLGNGVTIHVQTWKNQRYLIG